MNGDQHLSAAAYALDALPDEERAAFEAHLATCEECQDEVRGFQLTTARLGSTEEAVPPASLRASVLDAVARTPQERTSTVTPLGPRRPRATTRWLAIAAAVLLVTTGTLGVTTYLSAQRADELAATTASALEVLNAPDAEIVRGQVAGGGTGSIVVSRSQGKAVVAATGLPPVSGDSTYQLWAIGDEGAAPSELLDPDAEGEVGVVVDWPSDATALGLTVEPAGGSEQPTTDPVLVLEV